MVQIESKYCVLPDHVIPRHFNLPQLRVSQTIRHDCNSFTAIAVPGIYQINHFLYYGEANHDASNDGIILSYMPRELDPVY